MLKGAEIVLTPNASRLDNFRIDQFKVCAAESIVCTAMARYPCSHYQGRSIAPTSAAESAVEAAKEEGICIHIGAFSFPRRRDALEPGFVVRTRQHVADLDLDALAEDLGDLGQPVPVASRTQTDFVFRAENPVLACGYGHAPA